MFFGCFFFFPSMAFLYCSSSVVLHPKYLLLVTDCYWHFHCSCTTDLHKPHCRLNMTLKECEVIQNVFFPASLKLSSPPFSAPQVLQSALHRIRHGRTGSRLANLHRQHQHVSMWPRRLIMMGGDNHNEFYFQCSVGARRSASAPADSGFLIIAN